MTLEQDMMTAYHRLQGFDEAEVKNNGKYGPCGPGCAERRRELSDDFIRKADAYSKQHQTNAFLHALGIGSTLHAVRALVRDRTAGSMR